MKPRTAALLSFWTSCAIFGVTAALYSFGAALLVVSTFILGAVAAYGSAAAAQHDSARSDFAGYVNDDGSIDYPRWADDTVASLKRVTDA